MNGTREATNQPEQPNSSGKRRRRGAQPGNHNALKHGLYSQEVWADISRRKPAEAQDANPPGDGEAAASLQAEVAMLRSLIRRLFDSSGSEDSTGSLIEVLRALGVASTRLAVLLRTQRLLDGGQKSKAMQIITEALAEVMAEMRQPESLLEAQAEPEDSQPATSRDS
jgi:hypothetical protein